MLKTPSKIALKFIQTARNINLDKRSKHKYLFNKNWWRKQDVHFNMWKVTANLGASQNSAPTRVPHATTDKITPVFSACRQVDLILQTYNVLYNLRERHHNKTLILKTADLNERDFLIRNLYKRTYWLQPFNGPTPLLHSTFYVLCIFRCM